MEAAIMNNSIDNTNTNVIIFLNSMKLVPDLSWPIRTSCSLSVGPLIASVLAVCVRPYVQVLQTAVTLTLPPSLSSTSTVPGTRDE